MIRTEVRAMLRRWREVIAAGFAGAAGLWIASLGGYVLVPFGLAVAALAAGWAMIALRRVRFLREVGAPGMVEVDEGQVGYFGPSFGGFVALADLAELRLAEFYGARAWRLKTQDGQVLLIPVDAAGAERLYDAFAALPGIDMAGVTAALDHGQPTLPLWRRAAAPLPRA
ncbi:hypothetical protein [Albidovulum sp.]|uniref:hypothetical protein n=1 Tax=Albidovulum sp. TaxID=1872424 RepID=UPI0039B92875